MLLEHSVQDQQTEKTEKNDAGGKERKEKWIYLTGLHAAFGGGLKCSWRAMGVKGLRFFFFFLLSCAKQGRDSYFYFSLFIAFHQEEIFRNPVPLS